jgi:glucuronoarabinoxylan endo-1,4-beta-xylanase
MKIRTLQLVMAISSFVLLGALTAHAGSVAITWGNEKQVIDGFGACDKYATFSDAQADLLFSKTAGIGLSILRVAINSSGDDISPYANAQKAAARGAIVWGASWSPPGNWKDNNSETNGGHLLQANYDAWATRLAGFAAKMKTNVGVDLYAISVQNEPDYTATWNSCIYSTQEMVNFIKVLGPKVHALNPPVKLLAPDAANWGSVWGYADAILGDATAASQTDIIATHDYSYGAVSHSPISKPIWETECSSFEAFDGSIGNGLRVANWVHNNLTVGNVSAWHYWWATNTGDNQGLLNGSAPCKRSWTVGNYSKFVRPGYVRIDATPASSGGVSVTAFKDKTTGAFVIVAINTNSGNTDMTFSLGFTATSVTPNITSSALDLAAQAVATVSNGSFAYTLPGQSVTTFTGVNTGATSVRPFIGRRTAVDKMVVVYDLHGKRVDIRMYETSAHVWRLDKKAAGIFFTVPAGAKQNVKSAAARE